MARFKNPMNNYVAVGGTLGSPLWHFFFGPFYFAYKGCWGWCFFSFLLAITSIPFSLLFLPVIVILWLILSLFAAPIVNTHYRRIGWVQESGPIEDFIAAAERRTEEKGNWLVWLPLYIAAAIIACVIGLATVATYLNQKPMPIGGWKPVDEVHRR